MIKNKNPAKQLTFDNLPEASIQEAPKTSKRITITQMMTETGIDELTLNLAFKLEPSKTVFSKVKSDLFFNGQLVSAVLIRIPQGALATDEFEYSTVLDMIGIAAGSYSVKVEMYELWALKEKLWRTEKEVVVNYVPQNRQSRLVKVPTVKKVAGADLAVVSQNQKDIYREIEKTIKKEHTSKRDEW